MKRLVEFVGCVAVIVGGAWLALVTSWLRTVDPTTHHIE